MREESFQRRERPDRLWMFWSSARLTAEHGIWAPLRPFALTVILAQELLGGFVFHMRGKRAYAIISMCYNHRSAAWSHDSSAKRRSTESADPGIAFLGRAVFR
jgi:hypothetical protein